MDVIVVGGGIAGLSTAWWLSGMKGVRVSLVEQFTLGHDRGSSHGTSRISRTTYIDPQYVRMMQVAIGESWPRLEKEVGQRLHAPVEGCVFGPREGLVAKYAAAVADVGTEVVELDAAAARTRFPAMRFFDDDLVLADPTASVVAADKTISSIIGLLRRRGVALFEGRRVVGLDHDAQGVTLRFEEGAAMRAQKVVVTAGPWTGRLLPGLASTLKVIRQTVGYFELADPARGRIPHFPVWVHLGERFDEVHYGLPEYGQPGVKAAHHGTVGEGDDPDAEAGSAEVALEQLKSFVARRFAVKVEGLHRVERCLYTNTPDEGFLWGPLPEMERVVVGAGHSGHGFKFAPLMGRALAELAVEGHTDMPLPRADALAMGLVP